MIYSKITLHTTIPTISKFIQMDQYKKKKKQVLIFFFFFFFF